MLICSIEGEYYPVSIYLLKVNSRKALNKVFNMFKVNNKTERRQWRCSGFFISHLVLVFLLITLNKLATFWLISLWLVTSSSRIIGFLWKTTINIRYAKAAFTKSGLLVALVMLIIFRLLWLSVMSWLQNEVSLKRLERSLKLIDNILG